MTSTTLPARQDELVEYVSRCTGLSSTGSLGRRLREAVVATRATVAPPGHASHATELDREAFARVCDMVTVQESFFFREQGKLAWLRERVLPALQEQQVCKVRVWSAGCAKGEEAYTLAMLLTDEGLDGRYRIVGTDLSAAAVAAARSATYGRWSLRGVDDAIVARQFWRDEAGFHVRDHVREGVTFHQHNLLDPPPEDVERCHLILCRNVLIYLTPDAVQRVAQRLVAALAPGGWLLLGASDPLLDDVDGLDVVLTPHGVAYRRGTPGRPEAPSEPAPPPARSTRGMQRRSASRPAPAVKRHVELPALLSAGERALDLGQPRQAEVLARQAFQLAPAEPRAHRILVQSLAESGQLREALAAADRAVARFPMDAALRHLQAVVLLEGGDHARSSFAARQAVYLDSGVASAHLLLARGLELLGEHAAARRCRRQGHRLLAREDCQ